MRQAKHVSLVFNALDVLPSLIFQAPGNQLQLFWLRWCSLHHGCVASIGMFSKRAWKTEKTWRPFLRFKRCIFEEQLLKRWARISLTNLWYSSTGNFNPWWAMGEVFVPSKWNLGVPNIVGVGGTMIWNNLGCIWTMIYRKDILKFRFWGALLQ